MFISLKPLSQRGDVSVDDVINRLRPKLATVEGVSTFMQAQQDIRTVARARRIPVAHCAMKILNEPKEWTPKYMDALKKEPGIADVSSDQDQAGIQVNVCHRSPDGGAFGHQHECD